MSNRNKIQLSPHFALKEFENIHGWCMVHPSVIESLERLHTDLSAYYGSIRIIITDSTRTDEDNMLLAERLGWIEEGGPVSRDSRHLEKYGGIAVDIVVQRLDIDKNKWEYIPATKKIGELARQYFDFVKDDYTDIHIHCDNRVKGAN